MITLKKFLFSLLFSWVIFLFSPKNIFATYSISVNNLPSSINANSQQDIDLELNVNLGGSSEYYLRGAFSHPDSPSSYFGYTDGFNGTEAKNFYKIITDDEGEWTGILKIRPDVNSPYFKGEGNYNFKIGYYTAAGSGPNWKYESTILLAYVLPTPTQSPTIPPSTPTPFLSPTSPPTPTSTPKPPTPTPKPTATYKINEVKDQDGEVLSSVKVYVDEVYIHHYAPEVLTFCDDCQCDGYVACGFVQHTIKLEKTGYEDWSETKDFNAGDFEEVDPVMIFSEPNPTPTPTPTVLIKPTPTPTPKISPPPTFQKSDQTATDSGEVLGAELATFSAFYPYQDQATSEAAKNEATPSASNKILPKIFLGAGLLLLFVSASWLWYTFNYTSRKA